MLGFLYYVVFPTKGVLAAIAIYACGYLIADVHASCRRFERKWFFLLVVVQ
jgi:hypothetical protein